MFIIKIVDVSAIWKDKEFITGRLKTKVIMMTTKKRIYQVLGVVLIFVLLLGAVAMGIFMATIPEKTERDEGEQVPIAVTVVGVDEVIIISTGLLSADRAVEFPLIEMETDDGETIIGIIDITSLEKGDKILVIEEWKRGRQNTFRGYDWYQFAGYQQEGEIGTQET